MSISNPADFTGHAVVVTGGTKGIGFTIAETFLAAGADVLVCGRSEPEALPEADGRTASFFAADIRDADQAAAVVDAAAPNSAASTYWSTTRAAPPTRTPRRSRRGSSTGSSPSTFLRPSMRRRPRIAS